MRNVSRSALVPYSAAQMYALVADVRAYPEFLPRCTGATLHHQDEQLIEASLEFQLSSLKKTFRTRNRVNPGLSMDIRMVDGPFRHLSGGWTFEQLGADGSKVSLSLEFEFANAITDSLFGRYIEDTCNTLIDSFIRRADDIYG